jgi:SynChlorMet cassette protein ScmC
MLGLQSRKDKLALSSPCAYLRLANQRTWRILEGDGRTHSLLQGLAKASRLHLDELDEALCWRGTEQWVFVRLADPPLGASPVVTRGATGHQAGNEHPSSNLAVRACFQGIGSWATNGQDSICEFPLPSTADDLALQMMWLSLVLGVQAEEYGGLLLHAALASSNCDGIALAGPSGVGKSTAIGRLPKPWVSLCDDTTLLVQDEQGRFWAHPWPTWSDFMEGGPGGTWDVEAAVPLRAIFVLSQAQADRAEPLGAGHAAPLLVKLAEQGAFPMLHDMEPHLAREHRLKRFDTICTLAKAVPCYRLDISRTGEFWREIERVMGWEETGG